MMRTHLLRTTLAGAIAALFLVAGGQAGETFKAKAKAKFHSPFTPMILELKAAKHLLDQANHNYEGHRAKADAEIVKAIHVLEEHPHHKPHHMEGHKHKHHHQLQKISNAEMVAAEQIVKNVISQLHDRPKAKNDEHAGKAVAILRDAGRQIELGLAHVKDAKKK